jgi:hypothetical protein
MVDTAGGKALVCVLLLGLLVGPPAVAQQNDAAFDTAVLRPAYPPGGGPRLIVDEAHHNLHTTSGRYASFGAVAGNDGFRVEPWAEPFAAGKLPAGALLVVANAAGAARPADSAFLPAEIEAVKAWVAAGGSLLLIADHSPFGAAAGELAAAFGVRMLDGHVRDGEHRATELPGEFFLEFTAANGGLGDHPIVNGRQAEERLRRVVTFGGQALQAPAGSAVLLRLGAGAESVASPNDPASAVTPVGGLAQGLAIEHGSGRVVVLGEAGLFGAQVIEGEAARRAGLPGALRFGMNHPGTDDRQFLLNTLHWLARLL